MSVSMHARIGTAAKKIFRKEGEAGISMRRIADDLGVTATTIYRHFTDKDELIEMIAEEGFTKLERKLKPIADTKISLTSIKRMVDCYVDFAITAPHHFDLMFMRTRAGVRQFPDAFRNRESSTFNLLLDVMAVLIERRQIKNTDGLTASLAIWAQVHGVVALHRSGRFGNDPVRLRKTAQSSIQCLLDGLT